MVKPRRKQVKSRVESAQATRQALIAAGLAEIAKHGLDASLDGICARAKLTRGAFYVHFADREALLAAVMEHVLGNLIGRLAGMGTPDLAGAIRAFVGAAGSPALAPAGALRFHHVMEVCRRSRSIGNNYRGLVMRGRDAVAMLLAREQAAGRARTTPGPMPLADLLVVFALGVASLLELEIPIELGGLEQTLRDVVGPQPTTRRG